MVVEKKVKHQPDKPSRDYEEVSDYERAGYTKEEARDILEAE